MAYLVWKEKKREKRKRGQGNEINGIDELFVQSNNKNKIDVMNLLKWM